ncbi:MAG: hypothetical protein U5J83_07485, partial [Bryobacterales bacterium]|nr:hypothetical protein [Bryobacterales bacterium]
MKVPMEPWALAVCIWDEPRAVNAPIDPGGVTSKFEGLCRAAGAVCLVDHVPLPPSRSVGSLLRPVPRTQQVVTSVWKNEAEFQAAFTASGNQVSAPESLLAEMLRREHVAYWVAGPSIPKLAQAEERLSFLRQSGPNALVGGMRELPPRPPELPTAIEHPSAAAIDQHRLRVLGQPLYASLQYDRRAIRNCLCGYYSFSYV